MAWLFPPIAVSTAAIAAIRGNCEVTVSAGFMKVRWGRSDTLFSGSSDFSVSSSDNEIYK